MERDFFNTGFFSEFQRSTVGGGDSSLFEGVDDDISSSIDSMFSGVSLLSLLNSNPPYHDHFDFFTLMPTTLLPQNQPQHYCFPNLPHYPHTDNIPPLFSSSSSFNNIPDSLSLLKSPKLEPSLALPDSLSLLKSPKLEPSLALALEYENTSTSTPMTHFSHHSHSLSHSQPPLPFAFNFIPTDTTDSHLFHTLPDLLSLDSPSSSSSAAPKRRRFYSDPEETASAAAVMVPRSSALARQRRQKLGDKTRYLQKLLPWDKKMSTTTMLEETYKYVKFLQAQLASLQAMPSHSSSSSAVVHGDQQRHHHHHHNHHHHHLASFGVLGRLNRNQLLQVLVNSPVAQTLLSSQGRCVFSVEQLDMLITKRITNTTTASSLLSSTPNLF